MKLVKVALATLLNLVVFEVIGFVGAFVFDILSASDDAGLHVYVWWFVVGVFCGMFGYDLAGRYYTNSEAETWRREESAVRTGRVVLATTIGVFSAIFVALEQFLWPVAATAYVPDNKVLTIIFFIAIVGSGIYAHRLAQFDQKKTKQPA